MSYVVYDKKSTLLLRVKSGKTSFETLATAKAALTRSGAKKSAYAIAESTAFYATIEKKEIRHGIVGSAGKEFEVGVNTSWTSGPWSETYWCS